MGIIALKLGSKFLILPSLVLEGLAHPLVVFHQSVILFFKLLVAWLIFRLLIAPGGLPLLFLRWLSWTRTLPVITRTDTTLVDTMKNRVVAAADSTFQKSLRHCFLFANKYIMIVFLFTKAFILSRGSNE